MKQFFLIASLFIFLVGPSLAQTSFIINDTPNYWTVVINNEAIEMKSFSTHEIKVEGEDLSLYGLEKKTFQEKEPFIISHGFLTVPRAGGGFFLSQARKVPIFLVNDSSERLIEHHDMVIVLQPFEEGRLKNAHVLSNRTIELRSSLFVGGKLAESKDTIFPVIIQKKRGVVYF
jgi:hypothetical protein